MIIKKPVLGIFFVELINSPLMKILSYFRNVESHWVKDGYQKDLDLNIMETSKLITICKKLYLSKKTIIQQISKNSNKNYFFNILEKKDFIDNPFLKRFSENIYLKNIATQYLGNHKIHSLGLFYSKKNNTIDGSQMWHVDGDASKQLKLFVNISDVTKDNGPFEFFPKNIMNVSLKNKGLLKDINEINIKKYIKNIDIVSCVGNQGSNVIVDTSNCLHQGSRVKSKYRLVFCVQYLPLPNAVIKSNGKKIVGGSVLYNDI